MEQLKISESGFIATRNNSNIKPEKHIITHGEVKDLIIAPYKTSQPIYIVRRDLDYLPYGRGMIIRRNHSYDFNITLLPIIKFYKYNSNHYKIFNRYGITIFWAIWKIHIDLTWFKGWKLRLFKFERSYKK